MPTYQYAARTEQGKAVSGTLAAPSVEALADQLQKMGYYVTRTSELSAREPAVGAWQRWRRVHPDDLMMFNIQLAKLVQVGIPLVAALTTLAEQTPQLKLRAAISDAARRIGEGASFSDALTHHPRVFSALFIAMVRAGEASSRLAEILRRLGIFAKRQGELREQLKTATTYPVVLFCLGSGVATFLVLGIIPKFIETFRQANVTLPLPTWLLFQISQLLRHYWMYLVLGAAACWVAGTRFARTPVGRRQLDRWLIEAPIIGELVRKTAIARMTSTLGTLLISGVPVLEALDIAEQTCGNTVIADACRQAYTSVKQGGTISAAFQASRAMPPMVVQMVSVGEASSAMGQMMEEIAEHYDELVTHQIKRTMVLIEPIFLLLMGGMVFTIMASVLLPLFRMVHVIH